MKRPILLSALMLVSSLVFSQPASGQFPPLEGEGKTAVICHRGYWNCEAAGYSQNSIAALREAQRLGFWGSECDIHLTGDNRVIVNHDPKINGKSIHDGKFEELAAELLPNGERRPSIEEYLQQAAKSTSTRLIIEFKEMPSDERNDLLVDLTIAALKEYGLYDPQRVGFISFSHHICKKIASEHPRFINQYLNGNISPEKLAAEGINGMDYNKSILSLKPQWIKDCARLGMSSNVWTVNSADTMDKMIENGIGAITTNEPELLRSRLADKELR
ncbi:MAG: glycerophosphodiester phosphodiesterase family protein [Bacteroidales bacterium]|nr:glycerophosphodiester phosphodiesterase family protein [Bacteroidales bacterium]MDY3783630.1 glycerophosphodiester phosphodiesterase family protein [Candidatus Cryptobacteroides sp.]